MNAYYFLTDFILRELIFIRHVTDSNYRKGSLWLIIYKQKSCKIKNLNFSWGQILAFFVSRLQDYNLGSYIFVAACKTLQNKDI